ncbi:membrane protein insertion efficiency factor YidD [Anabaena sp. UHCC 0204]|uniref:membrane protein insertion efficiency factor YidD n=1 Tax=Anabaena sp. UHCC 0204 TaxID=2590009 RepID=UPI001445E656|nr:membrane protein insertion efficiency factor YidD [Anabaena sp. UHCC 0204]MTJ07671.1 membrane protein insertion efficiency factor YidD [Anabaena sp. UHCC 0204]
MQTSEFDSFARKISIKAITGYQRYISPHKGFRCAHRVLHGGESCSQYVKRVIADDGLKAAFVKSQARFQACKQANQIWRSQIENPELPEENEETENIKKAPIKTPQNFSFFNNNSIYCLDCADLSCDCGELLDIASDFSIADCNAPDCSSLDCGAADCSFLDCGGCSW